MFFNGLKPPTSKDFLLKTAQHFFVARNFNSQGFVTAVLLGSDHGDLVQASIMSFAYASWV